MDPRVFIKSLEDQLRNIKAQYNEVREKPKYFDFSSDELMENSLLWFLGVVQQADLEIEGVTFTAQEYLADESLSRHKLPPYTLLYPSLVWFMANLGRERLQNLFGVDYTYRLMDVMREFDLEGPDI